MSEQSSSTTETSKLTEHAVSAIPKTVSSSPPKKTSFEPRLHASEVNNFYASMSGIPELSDSDTDTDMTDSDIDLEDLVSGESGSDTDFDLESDDSEWEFNSEADDDILDPESPTGFCIIDIEQLQLLFDETRCWKCQSRKGLKLKETEKWGLASILIVQCRHCKYKCEQWTSKKMDKYFEVNRRAVLATRPIGKGCAGLKKCGAVL